MSVHESDDTEPWYQSPFVQFCSRFKLGRVPSFIRHLPFATQDKLRSIVPYRTMATFHACAKRWRNCTVARGIVINGFLYSCNRDLQSSLQVSSSLYVSLSLSLVGGWCPSHVSRWVSEWVSSWANSIRLPVSSWISPVARITATTMNSVISSPRPPQPPDNYTNSSGMKMRVPHFIRYAHK